MPIYEWECARCGSSHDEYEPKQNSLEKCMKHCEECGLSVLHFKRIGPTAFHLKGKGWAKDGYVNPTPGMPSGEKFIEQYRRELRDPEHPRKPGDILKSIGRGAHDDMSDIGDPRYDIDAKRNSKSGADLEADG